MQGLGAGVVPAVAYVEMPSCYPEESRPRMFAVLSTVKCLPAPMAQAVAALVAAAVGWRWSALGLLPLVIAAEGAGRAGLATMSRRSQARERPQYMSAICSAWSPRAGAALASLSSGVVPGCSPSAGSPAQPFSLSRCAV